MATECQLDYTREDKEMLDEAANRVWELSPEILERDLPEIEAAREDFNRAIEETRREDLARGQAEIDEKNPEYQARLQEATELKVGQDHRVLIRGFNASSIDNEGRARIQTLFPAIVNQASREIRYTGKFPPSEMDERGDIWLTVENWDYKEGRAIGEFHKQAAEMKFGKGEDELTPMQKNKLTREQMDTQLHWNFHTIHNILFTDEDRVEVERICEQGKKGWESKISKYAERTAKEGRNDEVFCECGIKFMTEIKRTPKELTGLEKANKPMYDFIGDRLKRLGRLSRALGLKTGEEK